MSSPYVYNRVLLPLEDELELQEAIQEHIRSGVKATIPDVMALWQLNYETPGNETFVVWLELGEDNSSGWLHCVRPDRQSQWSLFGMDYPWNQISKSLTEGTIVVGAEQNFTYPIFVSLDDRGKAVLIGIRVSDKGYIVTAHPIKTRLFRKLRSMLKIPTTEGGQADWHERYASTSTTAPDSRAQRKKDRRDQWEAGLVKGPGGTGVILDGLEVKVVPESTTCYWTKGPGDQIFIADDCEEDGLSPTTLRKFRAYEHEVYRCVVDEVDGVATPDILKRVHLFVLRPLELAYVCARETGLNFYCDVEGVEVWATSKNLKRCRELVIEVAMDVLHERDSMLDVTSLSYVEPISSSTVAGSSSPTKPFGKPLQICARQR